MIRANVVGIDELLDRLGDGSATQQDLLQHLNASLSIGWDTDAQIRFRLGWLSVLGVVRPEGDRWILVLPPADRPESAPAPP